MAKYDIIHTCGHTETHEIVGTDVNGERARKAAWLATTICRECYRASRDAARTEFAASSSAAAAALSLPALTGSDKQVAWAGTIREAARRGIVEMLSPGIAAGQATAEQVDRVAASMVSHETAASWWIDGRGRTAQQTLLAIGKNRYEAALTAEGIAPRR